ncbi:hypothetical protein I862_01085 [endosymbiont of Acanthamoeba sp. UWC8]|uniref:hypothetical protein n=1 Tax=endosymbiont of Acanthamoeba sp. UWC8 TaxID=86106 RepID=UPI0004D1E8F3|nr:hypothetical protein [endosymbiont of Acanthamoeba sp. UWC8]AIF80780.1 hypothetical protein I862_01085 [endosymbiont of Acanthamoeba sp. UWC8]
MKIIKLSNDDKVLSLKQALYATEPLHKDAQEKYEASTALISQAILTSAAYILTVISNQVSLTSSFVNSFVLNSADHLSGISK